MKNHVVTLKNQCAVAAWSEAVPCVVAEAAQLPEGRPTDPIGMDLGMELETTTMMTINLPLTVEAIETEKTEMKTSFASLKLARVLAEPVEATCVCAVATVKNSEVASGALTVMMSAEASEAETATSSEEASEVETATTSEEDSEVETATSLEAVSAEATVTTSEVVSVAASGEKPVVCVA
jgi:hypothetical protein